MGPWRPAPDSVRIRKTGWRMSKLQSFAIGMVMAAMGVAALFQVIQVDHVLRIVSIEALGSLSLLGSLVFFVFAFKDRN